MAGALTWSKIAAPSEAGSEWSRDDLSIVHGARVVDVGRDEDTSLEEVWGETHSHSPAMLGACFEHGIA
jgi:hypothetical protein